LQGGGIYIWGRTFYTSIQTLATLTIPSTATLTNTNVYENEASSVCSPFELSSIAPLVC